MVFDAKPFNFITLTPNCLFTIILMVLSGLYEMGCSDQAQDFQKNSKYPLLMFMQKRQRKRSAWNWKKQS